MHARLLSVKQLVVPVLLALSLIVGLQIVLTSPQLVADAQAQTLTTDDLLNDDFGSSTGLGQADIKVTIGNLIKVILGFLGIVAVLIIMYGGLIWMTAGGSEEKVKKAQQIIVAGAIGCAIILSAYAITYFVINEFINATQNSITE